MDKASETTDSFRCSAKSLGNHRPFSLPCIRGLDLRLAAWDCEEAPQQRQAKGKAGAGNRGCLVCSECENNNKTSLQSASCYHRVLAKLHSVSGEKAPPRKKSCAPQVLSNCCSNCCVFLMHVHFRLARVLPYPLTKCQRIPMTELAPATPATHTTQKFQSNFLRIWNCLSSFRHSSCAQSLRY